MGKPATCLYGAIGRRIRLKSGTSEGSTPSISTMKVYKIRDISTGLYSSGGIAPTWEKIGKFWTQKKYVKAHLRILKNGYFFDKKGNKQDWLHMYENAKVIEYELQPSDSVLVNKF